MPGDRASPGTGVLLTRGVSCRGCHVGAGVGAGLPRSAQLHPLVDPQLGQAWQLPALSIWTPHCMHIGASL
jgi:hypothetical protein